MQARVAGCALGFVFISSASALQTFPANAAKPASTPPDAAVAGIPNDPAGLLRQAAILNGPIAQDSKPLHLKATYEILDADGKKRDRGVYELFWVNGKKFKRSYSMKSFSQTDYQSETGLMRSGDAEWPFGPETQVENKLMFRLPGEATVDRTTQQMFERKVGATNLRCVTLNSKPPKPLVSTMILPTYCFDLPSLALRFESGTGTSFSELVSASTRNDFLSFNNRLVGRDIRVTLFDKPYINIHLEVLEEIAQVNDADFTPPPNAIPAPPMRTKVPQSAMDARIIKRGSNAYASLANPAGLETRVLLGFIIGKDGRVTHVFPISGSELLQTAAMQEVRQRIYQPYLVAGEPVEVESEIAMVFDKTH